jgi:CTP:molybdopterin cytidylyltransferase MocA
VGRRVIAGLVLAAGAATRFGAPKQLAPLDGAPLLAHAVGAMAAVPAIDRVVVVLGAHAEAVRAGVDLGGAEAVLCPEWAEGQAASLRCGVRALDGAADAVVITLGDQPRITPAVIARFAALGARHGRAARARAVYDGSPGHPVVLGADHLPALEGLSGDVGAREVLARVGALEIECGGLCSAADVDTPEELEAMRT